MSRRRTGRSGRQWERSRFGGHELYGKTIGVIGFGRIGQLVARRAQSFDMEVVAFDKFVAPRSASASPVSRALKTPTSSTGVPT